MAEQPQPPISPPQSTLSMFMKNTKDSIEILKDNHNQMAKKLNDVVDEINELKEFLTFTNKWYRRFIHKRHLKNKFK